MLCKHIVPVYPAGPVVPFIPLMPFVPLYPCREEQGNGVRGSKNISHSVQALNFRCLIEALLKRTGVSLLTWRMTLLRSA